MNGDGTDASARWLTRLDQALEAAVLTFVVLLPFPRTSGARSVALAVAIILWVVRTRWFHQPIRGAGLWLNGLIAAYAGWVFIAAAGSVDLVVSVKALRGDLSKFLLAYVLVIEVIRTPQQVKRFFAATVLASTVVVAVGAASAWTPERIQGLAQWLPVYHNQNIIAGYLVVPTVVLAGLSLGAAGAPRRVWWIGLFAAHAAMLFVTGSRTAVAATLIALGVTAMCMPRRRVALVGVLLLVLAAGMASVASDRAPAVLDRYLTLFEGATYQAEGGDSAMMIRQRIWAETVGLTAAYPWAGYGYGIGIFPKVFQRDRTDVYQQLRSPPHAHNVWLQALFETGGVGLLLLAAVVVSVLVRLRAALRRNQSHDELVNVATVIAGLTAVIVHSMAEALYGSGVFGIQFWGLMGVGVSATLERLPLRTPATLKTPLTNATNGLARCPERDHLVHVASGHPPFGQSTDKSGRRRYAGKGG